MDGFVILIIIFLIPFVIGIYCLKKFTYYRKKDPRGYKWKVYLVIGSILTFIIPGIVMYLSIMAVTITCYAPMIPPNVSSSLLLMNRKKFLEKYRDKIGNKVYEKIKATS
jgi:heme/copper-type cytochrome/quinol oxidase subunit 2